MIPGLPSRFPRHEKNRGLLCKLPGKWQTDEGSSLFHHPKAQGKTAERPAAEHAREKSIRQHIAVCSPSSVMRFIPGASLRLIEHIVSPLAYYVNRQMKVFSSPADFFRAAANGAVSGRMDRFFGPARGRDGVFLRAPVLKNLFTYCIIREKEATA